MRTEDWAIVGSKEYIDSITEAIKVKEELIEELKRENEDLRRALITSSNNAYASGERDALDRMKAKAE